MIIRLIRTPPKLIFGTWTSEAGTSGFAGWTPC
jgi:hypothetical protein